MIKIRNSEIRDKFHFVELFIISSPYFEEILGKRVKNILGHLFIQKGNLFSFKNVFIAEFKNEIAGMILGYPSFIKERDNLKTGILLFKISMPEFIFRIKRFLLMNKEVGKIEKNDFYISNIAIFSKFRGMGIGEKLIEFTEKIAIKNKSKRIVLDVEKENLNAINFYKHIGFGTIKESKVFLRKGMELNFYRMGKLLAKGESDD